MNKKSVLAVAAVLIVSNATAFDLGGIGGFGGGGDLGGLIGNFKDIGNDMLDTCYEPDLSISAQTKDLCSNFDFARGFSFDSCGLLPPIPGYKKKTKNVSLPTLGLESFCSSAGDKANNVISDIMIYDTENREDVNKYPGGKTEAEFYNGVASVDNIVKTDSLAKSVFKNSDQETLKYLLDVAKASPGLDDITDIESTDLKAPASITQYRQQRDALAVTVTQDLEAAKSTSVAGAIKNSIKNKQGAAAEQAAAERVAQLHELIDAGKAKRIGLMLDVNRRPDDLAIPTEDTIKYIRKDLRPKYIAKIRQQQKREALLVALINEVDENRKALVSLAANKEVILNEQFDEAQAQAQIDSIIR